MSRCFFNGYAAWVYVIYVLEIGVRSICVWLMFMCGVLKLEVIFEIGNDCRKKHSRWGFLSHDLSRTGGEISLRVEIPPHAEAWRMVIVVCYCYWLDDELNIRQKDWWIVRATLKTLHVYCVWFAGSECMRICAQRRMELIPKCMQLVPGWQHGDIGQRIACKPEWSESSGTGIWYPLPYSYKQKKLMTMWNVNTAITLLVKGCGMTLSEDLNGFLVHDAIVGYSPHCIPLHHEKRGWNHDGNYRKRKDDKTAPCYLLLSKDGHVQSPWMGIPIGEPAPKTMVLQKLEEVPWSGIKQHPVIRFTIYQCKKRLLWMMALTLIPLS